MWNLTVRIGKVSWLSEPCFAGTQLEGRGEGGLHCFFSEIGKSVLILGKNLIVIIYGLNFLFKEQFLGVSKRKNRRHFPAGPFFFAL